MEANDGAAWEASTNTWRSIRQPAASGEPMPFEFPAAVWTGTRMLVVSNGSGFIPSTFFGALYDPASETWTPTRPLSVPGLACDFDPPAVRIVWTGSRAFVRGGCQQPWGALYDPASDSWSPLSLAGAPEAVSGQTAVWTGTELVLFGYPGPGARWSLGR